MATPSVELLKRVPLFADLEPRELQRLAPQFQERQVHAGETISSEGAGAAGFFVIDSGTARVSIRGEERTTIGPGDYFGEIALIDEGARSATIVADTDLRCFGMTFWEFRPLVEGDARIAWKLLQALAKKLREAEGRFAV